MTPVRLPTRHIDPSMAELLKGLQPGDHVAVTQTIRVGSRSWPATATGVFRSINYLATGTTTDRVRSDDVVVPTVHFTKPNGELASISLDENTRISRA